MVGPLRVTRSVVVPERELQWRFSRSSGPGGQSVNTTDSRVELSLDAWHLFPRRPFPAAPKIMAMPSPTRCAA
jgi:hypothetical protein